MMTGRPLRPRSRLWWLALCALAVFSLRALVPVGYMWTATEGHSRLVLCPAGMHHAAGMHHGGHEAPASDHCPYAHAGGAGLLSAQFAPAEPYYSLLQPARAPVVISVLAAPPPRYHAPRGPPSLA
jgi:hypothetical protein